jgi:TPP-dependent trihydroxycyclohexane-1,2-dione (THcHDO) dehydratase
MSTAETLSLTFAQATAKFLWAQYGESDRNSSYRKGAR